MTLTPGTPAADGFAMPAEWEPHAACLMAWPSRSDLWGGRLDEAKVIPVGAGRSDRNALEQVAAAFPDRELVAVPGEVIAFGGGGPHCITQQIPAGAAVPA